MTKASRNRLRRYSEHYLFYTVAGGILWSVLNYLLLFEQLNKHMWFIVTALVLFIVICTILLVHLVIYYPFKNVHVRFLMPCILFMIPVCIVVIYEEFLLLRFVALFPCLYLILGIYHSKGYRRLQYIEQKNHFEKKSNTKESPKWSGRRVE